MGCHRNDGRGFAAGAGCLLLLRGLPADSVRMRCTIRETDGTNRRSRHDDEDGILWRRDQTRKQPAANENKAQGNRKAQQTPAESDSAGCTASTLRIGPQGKGDSAGKGEPRTDKMTKSELICYPLILAQCTTVPQHTLDSRDLRKGEIEALSSADLSTANPGVVALNMCVCVRVCVCVCVLGKSPSLSSPPQSLSPSLSLSLSLPPSLPLP